MARIKLENLVKTFAPDVTAVAGVNLDITDGEFMIFVGPSGCGKTTTLNMISGLEQPTSGQVIIGDEVVNDVEPGDRGLGMVFQNLALFPHMTVFENIAFGLRVQKVPQTQVRQRVVQAAETFRIAHLLSNKPAQCSGGEAQRVALARTTITNPDVLLLDEPLSSLDAKLRVEMRTELKGLHDQLGSTFVYVTHDQAEAMTMADRIMVMQAGRIQQLGTPLEIYRQPANLFVAGFFGMPAMNTIQGRVHDSGGCEEGYEFRSNSRPVERSYTTYVGGLSRSLFLSPEAVFDIPFIAISEARRNPLQLWVSIGWSSATNRVQDDKPTCEGAAHEYEALAKVGIGLRRSSQRASKRCRMDSRA